MPINNKNQVNIVLILPDNCKFKRKLKSNIGLDVKSNLSFSLPISICSEHNTQGIGNQSRADCCRI